MTSLLDDLNSSVTVILPGGIALHNFRTSQGNLRHVKITLRAYSLFEENTYTSPTTCSGLSGGLTYCHLNQALLCKHRRGNL